MAYHSQLVRNVCDGERRAFIGPLSLPYEAKALLKDMSQFTCREGESTPCTGPIKTRAGQAVLTGNLQSFLELTVSFARSNDFAYRIHLRTSRGVASCSRTRLGLGQLQPAIRPLQKRTTAFRSGR